MIPRLRSLVPWLAAFASCWTVSCAPEKGPAVVEVWPPATEALPVEETVVFDWDLADAGERRRWRRPGSEDEPVAGELEGLLLPWQSGEAHAERGVALDPREVETIEVRLAEVRGSDLELRWSSDEEEGFSPARSVTLDSNRSITDDGGRVFLLDMKKAPAWSTPVDRIRITLRSRGGGSRTLERVRGLRHGVSEEAWREGGPFRVDLGNEVRDGFIAPRSAVLTRSLRAPREASLRFAWGFFSAPRKPRFLELDVRSASGTRTAWTHEVAPGTAPAEWHEVEVDLHSWSGRDIELVWKASGTDPAQGLLVWGDATVRSTDAAPRRPDVVLISVDTLRSDRVQPVDPPRQTAPHIGAWARAHAVSFENLAVQATWTLPSHASMLTGLDSLTHGVQYPGSRLASSRVGLAETLRGAGYRTVAMTETGWLHPRFGLDQGFQVYSYRPAEVDDVAWLRTMVDRTVARLGSQRSQPLFTFLHTIVVHEYRKYVPAEEPATAYDRSVREMDGAFHRLLERAAAPEHRDRTLLVFTSDHGELLGEQGHVGHGYLHEANVRVPLLVQFPSGLGAGTVYRQQARTIDIVPTILDWLDLSPPEEVQGRSLLPLVRGEAGAGARVTKVYSSGGDFGLALRTEDGLKYVLRNRPRRNEAEDQEELWRIDGLGLQEKLDLPSHSRTTDFAAVARRLLASVSGLHLEVAPCPQATTLRIGAATKTVEFLAVKSIDLPPDSIGRWEGRGIEMKVAAARGGSLVVEQLPGPQVEVEVVRAGEKVWTESIDFAALGPLWAESGDGSRVRSVLSATCPVRFRWRSHGGQAFDSGTLADREVERQLKALGYLGDR